jgi:hypothetical protein
MPLVNLERAMGLEPTALCLGMTELLSAPEAPFPNLATRHPPVEAEDHQISNQRYYAVIRPNSKLIPAQNRKRLLAANPAVQKLLHVLAQDPSQQARGSRRVNSVRF